MAKRSVRRRPETVPVAALLIAVGGFLDAYTYIGHRVFANAQTGNIVLIAVSLGQRQWAAAASRLPSVGAYLVGLLAAHLLSTRRARDWLRHPVRLGMAVEMLVLAVLALLPRDLTTAEVTMPVSFVAAMQATIFVSVGGVKYNTTMATGNLRSMFAAAFTAVADRDRRSAREALVLGSLLLAFAAGAAVGAVTTVWWHQRSALLAAAAVGVALAAIAAETRRQKRVAASGADA